MAIEYGDEKGYFGKIVTGDKGLSEYEEQKMIDDTMSNKVERLLKDDSIMKDIDKEIQEMADVKSNENSKTKN